MNGVFNSQVQEFYYFPMKIMGIVDRIYCTCTELMVFVLFEQKQVFGGINISVVNCNTIALRMKCLKTEYRA